MNFVFSRQQSLFHVLAAYSIYNTVSQSTATQVFLRSWGELSGHPCLCGSFQGFSGDLGISEKSWFRSRKNHCIPAKLSFSSFLWIILLWCYLLPCFYFTQLWGEWGGLEVLRSRWADKFLLDPCAVFVTRREFAFQGHILFTQRGPKRRPCVATC